MGGMSLTNIRTDLDVASTFAAGGHGYLVLSAECVRVECSRNPWTPTRKYALTLVSVSNKEAIIPTKTKHCAQQCSHTKHCTLLSSVRSPTDLASGCSLPPTRFLFLTFELRKKIHSSLL